jgi:hypothetical protein
MKCAILQPTYLPWAGFFNLMHRVDVFVFLDDVQYERRTWQNRNRVLVQGAPCWLTVPVHRDYRGKTIRDVEVPADQWRRKHWRLLEQAYAHHPFADQMLEAAQPMLDPALDRLGELNIRIISALAARLAIGTRLVRSSELGVGGVRTGKLIGISERLGCDEYVSPPGSAGYLAEDRFTELTAVRLSFNEFTPAPYPQRGSTEFISHMSVLDVIANLGLEQTAAYIRNGPAPQVLKENA